jgi:hypothetical protein
MKLAVEPGKALPQALQIPLAVAVVQEARQPVVAALYNVLRPSCKIERRSAGHDPASPDHLLC